MKRNGILQHTSPAAKLIFSLFVVLSGFLIIMVIGLLLAQPLFGIGPLKVFDVISDQSHPDNLKLLKYLQLIQSTGLFIIPPLVLAWFFGGNIFKYLFLNRKAGVKTTILVTVITLITIPLVNMLAYYNSLLELPEWLARLEEWMKRSEESAKNLTELFLIADNYSQLAFNLFLIALVPAIGEELLFRGIFQRILSEWTRNKHLGILFSSLIFSAIHFQFYGFVPRVVLGMLFGYLLVWSGKMWVPIIAHFVNNGIAVLAYFLMRRNIIDESIEKIGTHANERIYLILLLIVLIILLIIFYRREKPGKLY